MMRFHIVRFVGFHFTRMQVETAICEALITESAASTLIFDKEAGLFFLARMTFATTVTLEGTLASKERQAHFFPLLRTLMAIDTIFSGATRTILTRYHVDLGLVARLQGNAPIVVHVVLSSRHDNVG